MDRAFAEVRRLGGGGYLITHLRDFAEVACATTQDRNPKTWGSTSRTYDGDARPERTFGVEHRSLIPESYTVSIRTHSRKQPQPEWVFEKTYYKGLDLGYRGQLNVL